MSAVEQLFGTSSSIARYCFASKLAVQFFLLLLNSAQKVFAFKTISAKHGQQKKIILQLFFSKANRSQKKIELRIDFFVFQHFFLSNNCLVDQKKSFFVLLGHIQKNLDAHEPKKNWALVGMPMVEQKKLFPSPCHVPMFFRRKNDVLLFPQAFFPGKKAVILPILKTAFAGFFVGQNESDNRPRCGGSLLMVNILYSAFVL